MDTGTRGVYFLANDPHIEWVRAFLESVRAWNRDIPIRMIPYDDRIERLSKLCSTYDFRVHSDPALHDLDRLGHFLISKPGRQSGMFRKLSSFWGPFEQFVYLDSDVIVAADVDRFVAAVDESQCDFAFAMHGETERVYLSEAMQREASAAGHELSINTG